MDSIQETQRQNTKYISFQHSRALIEQSYFNAVLELNYEKITKKAN